MDPTFRFSPTALSAKLAVFIKDIPAPTSISHLCSLFERNGLLSPLHVILSPIPPTSSSRWAICMLATPEQCHKALAMSFLVDSSCRFEIRDVKKSFSPSLHMCEALLNHHFTFEWSSRVDVKRVGGGENAKLVVSAHISFRDEVLVSHLITQEVDPGEGENLAGAVKFVVGQAKREALDKLEMHFPGSGKAVILQKIDT